MSSEMFKYMHCCVPLLVKSSEKWRYRIKILWQARILPKSLKHDTDSCQVTFSLRGRTLPEAIRVPQKAIHSFAVISWWIYLRLTVSLQLISRDS